jgi:hypothetical protein
MEKMDASFTILIMSIAQTCMIALGLTDDPQTGRKAIDKNMARFNLDLLKLLKDKTKGNLTPDENNFLDSTITDLQNKLLHIK